MGIRYYAYPLAQDLVDAALVDPWPYMSTDPLADAWGFDGVQRPDMLYLDKCWDLLQQLTHPAPDPPRPAHALVEGAVTHTEYGWIPWIKVLPPDVVAEVARDLSLFDEDDVDALSQRAGRWRADDREYVLPYLRAAQDFTVRMQRRGWGLVYLIG